MKALGAEIFRTPTGLPFDDPNSNIRVAERLAKEIPNSVVLNQVSNWKFGKFSSNNFYFLN